MKFKLLVERSEPNKKKTSRLYQFESVWNLGHLTTAPPWRDLCGHGKTSEAAQLLLLAP
jgi:hypothetical protein